jgi:hypothetical protein
VVCRTCTAQVSASNPANRCSNYIGAAVRSSALYPCSTILPNWKRTHTYIGKTVLVKSDEGRPSDVFVLAMHRGTYPALRQ